MRFEVIGAVMTQHAAVAARSAEQRPRRDSGRRGRAGWSALATLILLLVANSPGRVAAVASGPGAWSPTGSMQQGRAGHTATLLTNGQLLAAGGS